MAAPSPYSTRQRKRALRFAVVGNVVPIAVATATDFSSHHAVFFIGAIGGCLAPIVVTLVNRRQPILFYAAAYGGIPALTMLQAYSGGASSGYSILMMMAMIWFGLRTSDRELTVGIGVLAACSYGPMLIFGPPAYPVDWGSATLLLLVGFSVAFSLRAVTRETQILNARLVKDATVDDLTGLLNRRGWRLTVERELARAGREGTPVGLLLLDLDGLKEINDSRGHDEGDRVLIETAERMRAALRAGDVIARLGGDEFGALLMDTSDGQGLAAVDRLKQLTPGLGSFSAGAATWDGNESLDELLRRADIALYSAKTDGGGRVEIAPPTLEPSEVFPEAAVRTDEATNRE
ncbi:MAG: GGDEF domain-containing protein [Solirubrobacterales bacterium]